MYLFANSVNVSKFPMNDVCNTRERSREKRERGGEIAAAEYNVRLEGLEGSLIVETQSGRERNVLISIGPFAPKDTRNFSNKDKSLRLPELFTLTI